MKSLHLIKAEYLQKMAQKILMEAQEELRLYQVELTKSEELPAPPAEVLVVEMLPKTRKVNMNTVSKRIKAKKVARHKNDLSYDEEVARNIQVLQEFPVEYTGKAVAIKLYLALFNNGAEHPFMDRNHVMIEVLDGDSKRLNSKNCYIHKDNLIKYPFLLKAGLYSFEKKGANWFQPKEVVLMVD